MYLDELSISGFRGVGPQITLPLSHRTVIFGPNGSGKSTILQSIAWAIYGKLPLLSGGPFTREDAIVNDFFDLDAAEVSLTFSNGVRISRTRNKQSSTTRGTSPLRTSFSDDDGEQALEEMVGLNQDEFFAAAFLHQETIRNFITTTPDKRSSTIDRMLGTHLLRSLIKAVDPSIPAKAIQQCQQDLDRISQQLSQASIISREVLLKRKQEIGDPSSLPDLIQSVHSEISTITNELGLLTPDNTLAQLESTLEQIRAAQIESTSELYRRLNHVRSAKERYEQIAQVVVEDVTVPSDLVRARDDARKQLAALQAESLSLQRQQTELLDKELELDGLRGEVQDILAVRHRVNQLHEQLSTLLTEIHRGEQYTQILSLGHEYLEQVSPSHCPLCSQEIRDLGALLQEIEQQIPSTVSELREEYESVKKHLEDNQRQLENLEKKQDKINALEKQIEGLPADIDEQIKSKETEVTEAANNLSDLQAEIARLEGLARNSAEHQHQLEQVYADIEDALGHVPDSNIVQVLEDAISAISKQADNLQELPVQSVAQNLSRAKAIDEIRKEEEHLRQLESSHQTANAERKRIHFQIALLTELRNALQDISETTKAHQQEIVESILDQLDINYYYQLLDPHPAYRELYIEPEVTSKGTYDYWIKALTDDRSSGTHVQTRFSTAQANAAAVAIFLAVNQHLSKKFETVILDDPTQSMDVEHKSRLAHALADTPRQVIVATESLETYKLLLEAFDTPQVYELSSWSVAGTSVLA